MTVPSVPPHQTSSFVQFSLQTHKNVVYDFQNYSTYVCFKSELLDPKNHLPVVMLKFLSTTPQQYDFQNYNWYVCFKSELLDPPNEKDKSF